MFRSDPRPTETSVQPLQTLRLECDKPTGAFNRDLCAGAVTEKVAALPFSSDTHFCRRLEPGAQDEFVQGLRRPELGPAFG
jgi:hypothetical protein